MMLNLDEMAKGVILVKTGMIVAVIAAGVVESFLVAIWISDYLHSISPRFFNHPGIVTLLIFCGVMFLLWVAWRFVRDRLDL